jgi:predicted nucleic acid-binding protein
MPWCCQDETTAASEEMLDWALRGTRLHVPALWVWEILNVVAVTIKRQRITADRGREFLAQLGTLNFRIEPPPLVADLPRLQVLSDRHRLTAYDVAYLDLALRFGLPLATGDSELRRAARVEGIELLG